MPQDGQKQPEELPHYLKSADQYPLAPGFNRVLLDYPVKRKELDVGARFKESKNSFILPPPLPKNVSCAEQGQEFLSFLHSEEGNQFREGVNKLIKRLDDFREQHFPADKSEKYKTLKTNLLKFQKDLNSHGTEHTPESKYKWFSTYTQGVIYLSALVDALDNETDYLLSLKKTVVENLLESIGLCGTGAYNNLADAFLSLNKDLDMVLMKVKRMPLQALALRNEEQYAGSETHDFQDLLSLVGPLIGVNFEGDVEGVVSSRVMVINEHKQKIEEIAHELKDMDDFKLRLSIDADDELDEEDKQDLREALENLAANYNAKSQEREKHKQSVNALTEKLQDLINTNDICRNVRLNLGKFNRQYFKILTISFLAEQLLDGYLREEPDFVKNFEELKKAVLEVNKQALSEREKQGLLEGEIDKVTAAFKIFGDDKGSVSQGLFNTSTLGDDDVELLSDQELFANFVIAIVFCLENSGYVDPNVYNTFSLPVGFGFDLRELDAGEDFSDDLLETAEANKRPILVNKEGKFVIYGCRFGVWKKTELKDLSASSREALHGLPFAKGKIERGDPFFSSEHAGLLRKGQDLHEYERISIVPGSALSVAYHYVEKEKIRTPLLQYTRKEFEAHQNLDVFLQQLNEWNLSDEQRLEVLKYNINTLGHLIAQLDEMPLSVKQLFDFLANDEALFTFILIQNERELLKKFPQLLVDNNNFLSRPNGFSTYRFAIHHLWTAQAWENLLALVDREKFSEFMLSPEQGANVLQALALKVKDSAPAILTVILAHLSASAKNVAMHAQDAKGVTGFQYFITVRDPLFLQTFFNGLDLDTLVHALFSDYPRTPLGFKSAVHFVKEHEAWETLATRLGNPSAHLDVTHALGILEIAKVFINDPVIWALLVDKVEVFRKLALALETLVLLDEPIISALQPFLENTGGLFSTFDKAITHRPVRLKTIVSKLSAETVKREFKASLLDEHLDFAAIRVNLHKLIEMRPEAIDVLLEVLPQSERAKIVLRENPQLLKKIIKDYGDRLSDEVLGVNKLYSAEVLLAHHPVALMARTDILVRLLTDPHFLLTPAPLRYSPGSLDVLLNADKEKFTAWLRQPKVMLALIKHSAEANVDVISQLIELYGQETYLQLFTSFENMSTLLSYGEQISPAWQLDRAILTQAWLNELERLKENDPDKLQSTIEQIFTTLQFAYYPVAIFNYAAENTMLNIIQNIKNTLLDNHSVPPNAETFSRSIKLIYANKQVFDSLSGELQTYVNRDIDKVFKVDAYHEGHDAEQLPTTQFNEFMKDFKLNYPEIYPLINHAILSNTLHLADIANRSNVNLSYVDFSAWDADKVIAFISFPEVRNTSNDGEISDFEDAWKMPGLLLKSLEYADRFSPVDVNTMCKAVRKIRDLGPVNEHLVKNPEKALRLLLTLMDATLLAPNLAGWDLSMLHPFLALNNPNPQINELMLQIVQHQHFSSIANVLTKDLSVDIAKSALVYFMHTNSEPDVSFLRAAQRIALDERIALFNQYPDCSFSEKAYIELFYYEHRSFVEQLKTNKTLPFNNETKAYVKIKKIEDNFMFTPVELYRSSRGEFRGICDNYIPCKFYSPQEMFNVYLEIIRSDYVQQEDIYRLCTRLINLYHQERVADKPELCSSADLLVILSKMVTQVRDYWLISDKQASYFESEHPLLELLYDLEFNYSSLSLEDKPKAEALFNDLDALGTSRRSL